MSKKSKIKPNKYLFGSRSTDLISIIFRLKDRKFSELTDDQLNYISDALEQIIDGKNPHKALDIIPPTKDQLKKERRAHENAFGVAFELLQLEETDPKNKRKVQTAIKNVVKDNNYPGYDFKTVERHYYKHRDIAEYSVAQFFEHYYDNDES